MRALFRLADNSDPRSLATRLRRRRFAFFRELLSRIPRPVRILDVGGSFQFWKMMGLDGDPGMTVTVLNVSRRQVAANAPGILGDARHLPFADRSFDVIFSNSVIEHVGPAADQQRMAAEVRRVGRRFFVQTPNRYFPIEPHFLVPFFQFLPLELASLLVRNFNLGHYERRADPLEARELVTSVRLLSRGDVAALFPDADIYVEKLAGLAKSFIAYGGWPR